MQKAIRLTPVARTMPRVVPRGCFRERPELQALAFKAFVTDSWLLAGHVLKCPVFHGSSFGDLSDSWVHQHCLGRASAVMAAAHFAGSKTVQCVQKAATASY